MDLIWTEGSGSKRLNKVSPCLIMLFWFRPQLCPMYTNMLGIEGCLSVCISRWCCWGFSPRVQMEPNWVGCYWIVYLLSKATWWWIEDTCYVNEQVGFRASLKMSSTRRLWNQGLNQELCGWEFWKHELQIVCTRVLCLRSSNEDGNLLCSSLKIYDVHIWVEFVVSPMVIQDANIADDLGGWL